MPRKLPAGVVRLLAPPVDDAALSAALAQVPAARHGEAVALLRRLIPAAAAERWCFMMVNTERFSRVNRWLLAGPAPMVAVSLLAEMMTRVQWETGEVDMVRAEMCEAIGEPAPRVSVALARLIECRAILRVAGEPGRPGQRYRINPWLATNLPGRVGDLERSLCEDIPAVLPDPAAPLARKARQPSLRLIGGGAR